MYQKKRIRTVIITGEGIRKAVSVILILILIFAGGAIVWWISKIHGPSGDLAVKIISEGINDKDSDIKDFGKKVLGFDISDAKTILYKYYAQFESTDNIVEAVESPPPETQQEQSVQASSDEHAIEEINAAKGMQLSNLSGIEIDPMKLVNEPLNIQLDNQGPQVLIIHTHTTESFTDSGKTKYSSSESDRSTDNSKNMIAVGEVIKNVLEQHGIQTIHDTTFHDYPSYNGAYTRSMTTVKNNLAKYPSIKVVLDVHRDGIVREDGTKVKVAADINGEKAAQCMFVIGSNATLKHDNWQENMKLACKLQNYANINYPNLMRPINVRKERFNQQVSTGSIIIEVGSNGNTLEEAKKGAEYIAKTLCAVLSGK